MGIYSFTAALAYPAWAGDNYHMTLTGYIQNGVVVLDGGKGFPEGTRVSVSPIPLIPLDEENVASIRKQQTSSEQITWDEIFRNQLIVGSAPSTEDEDDLQLTGDNFHF